MSGIAVDGPDSPIAELAHRIEVQLDDDGLEPILMKEARECPADRSVADNQGQIASGPAAVELRARGCTLCGGSRTNRRLDESVHGGFQRADEPVEDRVSGDGDDRRCDE